MFIASSFLAPAFAAALNTVSMIGGVTPEPATQIGTAVQVDDTGVYVNGSPTVALAVEVGGVTYRCLDVAEEHPAWDPCHARNFQGVRAGVRW